MGFLLTFSLGVSPSILEFAKGIPVHKKNQTCFAQIIGQYRYYPVSIKSLKKNIHLIEKNHLNFLIKTTLYNPFTLAFGSFIHLHMRC